MKSRIFAVIAVTLVIGSESRASILSASSEAVREPSAKSVEYWNATTLQQDLNSTLRDAAEASAPAGPLASTRAPVTSGGFMVNDGGSSGAAYTPFGGSAALDGLFDVQHGPGALVSGSWSPNGPVVAGNHGHGGRRGRGRDRGWDDKRDRDNPYATPEPSTWVLIGSGLLMLGAYAGLRRRDAVNF